MPLTQDGLASGLDTDSMVEKLVKVEGQKIELNRKHKEDLKNENDYLEDLKTLALRLEESLKVLYNFDSPFEKNVVTSEPEGYVTGIASKHAIKGDYKIDIGNLATQLSFGSNTIPNDYQFKPSRITVNDKSADFTGGSIQELRAFLNKEFGDLLSAKAVRKSLKESVLVIESKKTGLPGILEISDTAGFFKETGVTGDGKKQVEPDKELPGQTDPVDESGKREDYTAVLFDLKKLSVVREGETTVTEDQKELMLGEDAARRLEIDTTVPKGKKIKAITFQIEFQEDRSPERYTTGGSGEGAKGPFEITEGPVDSFTVKDITVYTYNVTRERERPADPQQQQPEQVKQPDPFDYGVEIPIGGRMRKFSLKDKGMLITIPVKEVPEFIDFYTSNKEVIFKDLKLVYQVTGPGGSQQAKTDDNKNLSDEDRLLQEQQAKYPNLINPARNANLTIDGVDVERENNIQLTDIIDGATIDLLKETPGPITIHVRPNLDKSVEMVENFIKNYNDLLDYARAVSTGVVKDEQGNIIQLDKKDTPPLVTSSLVRSLINGMQTRTANAYPSFRDPHLKILQMIGIGTGKAGSKWADISNMHLMIEDVELLRQMVTENPTAVREFFGIDTNGDRLFDSGLAHALVEFLKAYTSGSTGIILSQIKSNDRQMKDIDKEIARQEEHLAEYEKKLKQKFGVMEGHIQQQKATGNQLRQKFNSGGNEKQ